MAYDLKIDTNFNQFTERDNQLDKAMAKYYGESVQGLRLNKIATSEIDSQNNHSEHDKTCSSIFSCNLFAKSSSDSANSSSIKQTNMKELYRQQESPTEDKILME
jgi:hypothetical protein